MVGKKPGVPDAWDDDDWEVKADRAIAADPDPEPGIEPEPSSMTKAQRLAQHAESNKKLWQSAETAPEPFHFLAARPEPPLATEFKPAVKVLSRKPAPKMVTKRDPVTGALSQLRVADDDSDEEGKNNVQLTPEEMRAKQQREREEKQRRYDEVRAKIFGTTTSPSPASGSGNTNASNPSSGTSTPGNATPPRSQPDGRNPRGRGRGGRGGYRQNDNRGDGAGGVVGGGRRPGSQSGINNTRELYDPNYLPKPNSQQERRGGGAPLSSRPIPTPRDEEQAIRSPRGPDGNSRGFGKRGAKTS